MSETPARAPQRARNRLAGETSAYLRQHMHNPVDWHPWGEEALERARREDKPLLVSIGYSACHWCHVMERESFEDPETAEALNRDFLPVKVDREERPDLDQIYMECALRLLGHGGWPLTVFCTPDGRPFYAGTYFPPEPRHGLPSFRQVLGAVAQAYREQKGEVEENARRIAAALAERPEAGAEGAPPGPEGLARCARTLLRRADRERGGIGGAPKFPMPTSLNALLAAEDVLPAAEAGEARDFAAFTCREMARGGLFDQLGGGFHRYCVDAHWGVPHFEKMLYDQGQLLFTYAEAWRRTGDGDLAWPVRETAAWLEEALRGPEGGFSASQDADSEGEEGRYYVWTPEEVRAALGPERGAAFCRAYGVTEEGTFEKGRSVLRDVERAPRERFAAERAALLERRRERVPPEIDPKRLAAWNGLAVSGLAYAGSVLEEPALLASAARAADFVRERLVDGDGRLLRVFCEGEAKVRAFLDDHAAMLAAALDLYRAGTGARFLGFAGELAGAIVERFYDEAEGELFFTPDDGEALVHRPRSDQDGAVPHATGLAVLGLLRLANLSGREELASVARRVLRTHASLMERVPAALPTLLRAAAWDARGLSAAVIVGEPEAEATRALASRARRVLAPEEAVVVAAPGGSAPASLDPAWLAGREPVEGRAAAYVCRGSICSLPVTDPDALAPLRPPAAPA